jgi:hypothetical protein
MNRTQYKGRAFKGHHQPPTMQKAIMALLEASPMPWTSGMLVGYLGSSASFCAGLAADSMRIWRIEPGLYTANLNYCVVPITDEMIARYTGKEVGAVETN